jgi:hypothetical protein
MRKTDEQKKAALQQRIAALKEKVRRIEKRGAEAERRARNHRLIVLGAIVESQIIDNSHSVSAQAIARDIEDYVTAHPRDRNTLADLLACLTASSTLRQAQGSGQAAQEADLPDAPFDKLRTTAK